MQNNTFFGDYQPCNVIVLEKTTSTNDYTKQILSNFKPQYPLTAIMTKEQTDGRGQRGTKWLAKANQNLTTSLLYAPTQLETKDQFALVIISSLAVYDALKPCVSAHISIKWPNDIMVANKKIAGILIENKLQKGFIPYSIIGIGINILQTDFEEEIVSKTTSLKLENSDINLTKLDLLESIIKNFQEYMQLLDRNAFEELWSLYNNRLFRRDITADFSSEGQLFSGKITHVDREGYLHINSSEGVRKYDLKTVQYQL